ncbi:hypothetical protein GEV27_01505 [Aeromicrobium sp. S22]|uniref:hypothetical protein n=1 Tax=Aeromicrobium sp. S22 TaxID=2662029 RepID=UPI00129D9899|nr:hypothetical protein [Aeromicrobium sp. S22]MRK00186.1 hypothetical protein [Aeromicrobium sp. S22]
MRAARVLLGALGAGLALWGLWQMRDLTREQLTSEAFWAVGAVVLHDAVLAPIAVLVGWAGHRLLPGPFRRPAAIAFIVWGTLTVAFFPTLSGQGGKPGNDTVLGLPYVLTWLVMTGMLIAYVVGDGLRRRRSRSVATAARAS